MVWGAKTVKGRATKLGSYVFMVPHYLSSRNDAYRSDGAAIAQWFTLWSITPESLGLESKCFFPSDSLAHAGPAHLCYQHLLLPNRSRVECLGLVYVNPGPRQPVSPRYCLIFLVLSLSLIVWILLTALYPT